LAEIGICGLKDDPVFANKTGIILDSDLRAKNDPVFGASVDYGCGDVI
jgi:hypothetical protein